MRRQPVGYLKLQAVRHDYHHCDHHTRRCRLAPVPAKERLKLPEGNEAIVALRPGLMLAFRRSENVSIRRGLIIYLNFQVKFKT